MSRSCNKPFDWIIVIVIIPLETIRFVGKLGLYIRLNVVALSFKSQFCAIARWLLPFGRTIFCGQDILRSPVTAVNYDRKNKWRFETVLRKPSVGRSDHDVGVTVDIWSISALHFFVDKHFYSFKTHVRRLLMVLFLFFFLIFFTRIFFISLWYLRSLRGYSRGNHNGKVYYRKGEMNW